MKARDERLQASSSFTDDDPFLLKFLPGSSAAMRELRVTVHRLNMNVGLVGFVLLTGETGTGKNHVARTMAGHRRWLTIKDPSSGELDPGDGVPGGIAELDDYTKRLGEKVLSELTETIAASELFGHVRGAFSDAKTDHPGLFGDEGYDDILLDEIGEASLTIQAKLLAVLEGREFIPVGGTSKKKRLLKSRVLMATNRGLDRMVAEGSFRQDLFFRVRRHVVRVPPLRAHLDDLPDIAAAIIERLCSRDPKRAAAPRPALTPADIQWARNQAWEGNIRELEELVEQWLLAEALESLQELAGQRAYAGPASERSQHDVSTKVHRAIEEIVTGRRPSPGSFGKFIKDFTDEIEDAVTQAVVVWYRDRRPDRQILQRLFPDMTWESIKSVMSRAGKR